MEAYRVDGRIDAPRLPIPLKFLGLGGLAGVDTKVKWLNPKVKGSWVRAYNGDLLQGRLVFAG